MEVDLGRPDPGEAADLAEFIALLGRLRIWAGAPSFRTLAKLAGPLLKPPRALAQSTIGDVFQARRRRLDLDLVVAIVRALGLDRAEAARWRDAAVAVQSEAKTGGPAGVFRQLPADLATFTGREAELKEVFDAVGSVPAGPPTVVVSAIEGMAGVGKTQLAVHAAHELVRRGEYADIQLYVNLRGFDLDHAPIAPAAVLDAFLRQLGVAAQHIPDGLAERAAMFRDRIHGRHALVVLDNAADEEQVRDLIPAGPTCLVLVTSRRSLAALDNARHIQVRDFKHGEALELLAKIAGGDRVAADPTAASDIVEMCGRLPLAVALAAARLRSRKTWSLADLADYLRGVGLPGMSVGGRGLHPVFEMSLQALSGDARRLFLLIAVQPVADVTAEAAAALSGGSPGATRLLLEQLQDENLLQSRIPGRFEQHDLLRAWARGQAEASIPAEARHEAVRRLLTWYLVTVDGAGRAMYSDRYNPAIPPAQTLGFHPGVTDSAQAMVWCEQEHANLIAAADLAAAEGVPVPAWRLPVAMAVYLGMTARWRESHRLHLAALAHAPDDQARGTMLINLGFALTMVGDRAESERCYEAALAIFRDLGDRYAQSRILGKMAWLMHESDRAARGLDYAAQAVDLARAIDDPGCEVHAAHNLAACLCRLGRLPEALEQVLRALDLSRGLDSASAMPRALFQTGEVLILMGRFAEAEDVLREVLEIVERTGDRFGGAEALGLLGDVLRGLGRTSEACEVLARALAVFEDFDAAPEAACVRRQLAAMDALVTSNDDPVWEYGNEP